MPSPCWLGHRCQSCWSGAAQVNQILCSGHALQHFMFMPFSRLPVVFSWCIDLLQGMGVRHALNPDPYRGAFGNDGPRYAEDVQDLIQSATCGQVSKNVLRPGLIIITTTRSIRPCCSAKSWMRRGIFIFSFCRETRISVSLMCVIRHLQNWVLTWQRAPIGSK